MRAVRTLATAFIVLLAALVAFAALLAAPRAALSDETTSEVYWPSDMEKRLSTVEDDIVSLIRNRAAARRRKDREEVKRLDERLKDLEKEQVQLLRDTHRIDW
jgi:hypothetical protein